MKYNMIQTRFPLWYPFQEIESLQFKVDKIDEIEKLIEERKSLYNSEDDYDFKKKDWETEDEYLDRVSIDRKAYTIVKMGVALDPKLTAWFIEVEGDLFQKRFIKSPWKIKEKLLTDLFPTDKYGKNWMYLHELSDFLGENLNETLNIVDEDIRINLAKSRKSRYNKFQHPNFGLLKVLGVNFRYASFLVRTRRSQLYRGWVIDTVEKLAPTIKKRFEEVLRQDIMEYGERIETEGSGPIKRLANQINDRLKDLIRVREDFDFSNYELEGSYEDNLLIFPPCIQDLMITMKNVGYLKHHNRFQLGLFLKHTGMNVDEQMEYWFNFAVDNLNITYEQFEKNVGYTIRHLYGLEGKKVDYNMMSCGTIQSSGNYHCRFQDLNIDKIKELVKDYIVSLPGHQQAMKAKLFKEELDPLIGQGKPSQACAKYLELTIGPITDRISHPLQYLEMAAKSSGKLKEEANLSDEEEDISEIQGVQQ